MTRRPVSTEDGRIVYFDEATGKYYEKDEPPKKGLTALDEHPSRENPNREPGDPWDEAKKGRWAFLREVKR